MAPTGRTRPRGKAATHRRDPAAPTEGGSMKPPSERKTRLTEATLEWLKERASATEWKQIELLKPAGAEAILNYVYTVAPAAYEDLHRLCLVPPDLRIDQGGVPPPTTAEIVSGGPVWKTLAQA